MQKLENEEYNGKGVYKDSDSGRRHVKTTCQVCKKEFFISITTEKREDKGKYCSHSCAAKKGGETKSELVNQEKENNPNWKGGVSENAYRYRKRQKERHPEKVKARRKAQRAVKKGYLEKQPCVNCGSTENLEAHHEDYDKPLDVTWLCKRCHKDYHDGKIRLEA